MTWAADQRQAFIKERIEAGHTVNRAEVASRFNCTKQTVAADLARFATKYPGLATYDRRIKAYVRADLAAQGPVDWKARALTAEAKLADAIGALEQISNGADWPGAWNIATDALQRLAEKEGGS